MEFRTNQDGEGCHNTAAEGENDATRYVGAVGRFNGNVEIECIEDPSRTQKRGQDGEEGGNSSAVTAFTLAAATAAASTSTCSLL